MKECPKSGKGNGNHGNKTQSASVSQPERVSPSTSSFGGGTNRLYVINSLQEKKESLYVVNSMICL